MSELSEILKSEIKENEIKDYEEIKPQSEENPDDSREYIDDLFSKEILNTDIVKDKYPCQEIMDDKTYYYDDNGKIYRVDNELAPNTEYVINGYEYMTDNQGRIVFAKGQLDMKVREGRLPIKDSIESIGRGDQKEGDDRGHLIGDQFNGSNGLENMIPQNANINRNDFKNFENGLAKEVKAGKEVKLKIEPIYEGNSRRPTDIVATYSINGEESVIIFPNS